MLARASRRPNRWLLLTILLVCWLLLNVDLEGRSLWTDEVFTAEWIQLPVGDLIQRTADDVHPPLYFLGVQLWSAVAGRSDFALRFPSLAAGWLSVAVLYRLARGLAGGRVALLCAGVWGFSPALILYARMARYYAPTTLCALLATYTLWRALDRGAATRNTRWLSWLAYVMAGWAAMFSFYLSGLLLLAHGVFVLRVSNTRGFLRWLLSVGGMAVLLLPWAGVVAGQTVRRGGSAADLAFGSAGFLLKAGYTTYAFALGESMFPWRPLAIVGATCILLLFGAGIEGWRKRRLALPVLALLIIPLAVMALVIASVSPRTAFVSMPARALFVAPYFALVIGGAVLWLRPRALLLLLSVAGVT